MCRSSAVLMQPDPRCAGPLRFNAARCSVCRSSAVLMQPDPRWAQSCLHSLRQASWTGGKLCNRFCEVVKSLSVKKCHLGARAHARTHARTHTRKIVGRSSSTSSFHASLLQAIGGVRFLALCPQVVSSSSMLQIFRDS